MKTIKRSALPWPSTATGRRKNSTTLPAFLLPTVEVIETMPGDTTVLARLAKGADSVINLAGIKDPKSAAQLRRRAESLKKALDKEGKAVRDILVKSLAGPKE